MLKKDMSNYTINLNRTDTTYRNESLEAWIRSIRGYKILSASEEEQIIQKAQNGDSEALNTIIKSNQRFLLSAARAYSRDANEILDLISEGNLALLRAVKNYNPSYGIKFISYAAWWIKGYMSEYFKTNSLIRHRMSKDVEQFIKNTKENFRKENGFDMPDHLLRELAKDEFERDFKRSGSYLKQSTVYFDDDITPEDFDGDSLIEKLTCVENDALPAFHKQELLTAATKLVDKMCQNQIERDVIIHGYGLFDEPQLSDYEISQKHNITEKQVSYVRRKVIRRMISYVNGEKLIVRQSKLQKPDVE